MSKAYLLKIAAVVGVAAFAAATGDFQTLVNLPGVA